VEQYARCRKKQKELVAHGISHTSNVTMRNPSPGAPTTWSAHKEQGKRHWNASQYEEALASYRAALASDSCPAAEKQILLSVS
jgi:Flp pilus assembly protein TadD